MAFNYSVQLRIITVVIENNLEMPSLKSEVKQCTEKFEKIIGVPSNVLASTIFDYN